MSKLEGGIPDKKSALGSLVEFELWPQIRVVLDEGNITLENEMKEKMQEFVKKYLKHFEEDDDVQKILLDVVMERIKYLTTRYKEKTKNEER